MILAAAAVFATGNQEVNEDGVVELERGELARNSYLDDLEKIEVTGVVKFESPVAELRVGGKDYTLTAPGGQMLSGYLSEGQRITVSGYLLEEDLNFGVGAGRTGRPGGVNSRFENIEVLEGNINLLVEAVEIDGTVYQLPWVDGESYRQNGLDRRGNSRQSSGSRGMGSRGQGMNYSTYDCPIYN